MPLSRRLTHFSLPLDALPAWGRDHFLPTSIERHATSGHPRFRIASRKIVSLTRVAHGKQRAEKNSAQWFRFICLVCAAKWKRSVRLRSVTILFWSKTRPRRLVQNFHFLRESLKLERWAKVGSLAFILQRILELLAMPAWSFAGMRSWRKSCARSENMEWSRATFTISLGAISAWTKCRLQYSRLSFHIWKHGRPRAAPLRISTGPNSRARG